MRNRGSYTYNFGCCRVDIGICTYSSCILGMIVGDHHVSGTSWAAQGGRCNIGGVNPDCRRNSTANGHTSQSSINKIRTDDYYSCAARYRAGSRSNIGEYRGSFIGICARLAYCGESITVGNRYVLSSSGTGGCDRSDIGSIIPDRICRCCTANSHM